eukprot:4832483-Pleurochrysis_carterae.AAC.4
MRSSEGRETGAVSKQMQPRWMREQQPAGEEQQLTKRSVRVGRRSVWFASQTIQVWGAQQASRLIPNGAGRQRVQCRSSLSVCAT